MYKRQKKPSDSKQEKAKEKEKEGEKPQVALPNGGNFDYNSIKTVAASGNVKASYTNKEGETSTAQADKITYNAKTGEIILTGSPVDVYKRQYLYVGGFPCGRKSGF